MTHESFWCSCMQRKFSHFYVFQICITYKLYIFRICQETLTFMMFGGIFGFGIDRKLISTISYFYKLFSTDL